MSAPPPPPKKPPPGVELTAERRIFRIIAEAPGIHVREIERRAGVAYGAVDYHLRKLEEQGVIRSQPSDQLKVYFTTEFPKGERVLAAAIRAEPTRRILAALLSFGELAHGELSSVTGLGLSTVSHHAGRLARKGILAARRDGRRTLFALADRARVERALVRHGHSVGDAALDAYITVWTEWRRPRSSAPEAGGASDRGDPPPPS